MNALTTLRRAVGVIWSVIASPWRLFQSIRRSMTPASASVLIISIMTLNIIWGYPWTGMFAATLSMLTVGWLINRAMHPNLRLGFSLPSSAPAGNRFVVTMHVENRGRLPAFDLSFGFEDSGSKRAKKNSARDLDPGFSSLSPTHWVAMIQPQQNVDLSNSITFQRRGVHPLPDVVVRSMFPFHLYCSSRTIESKATIAITPRILSGDEDSDSREMLSALGGWSRQLLSGDDMDYTGSREYEVGMPVRRWDFASWARLGRPIIREFQSPSIQTVTLLVDACPGDIRSDSEPAESFERLMSIAATAVHDLTRNLVQVRLYVTDEEPSIVIGRDVQHASSGDVESLLIRLAASETVSKQLADARIAKVLEQVGRHPVLVLTMRPNAGVWRETPVGVTVLRVDRSHRNPEQSRSSRPLASVGRVSSAEGG